MANVMVYPPGPGLARGYDYNYFGVPPQSPQSALGYSPLVAPAPAAVTIPAGLPFGRHKVKKRHSKTVVARAQVPFQPSFLVIPDDIADKFVIEEIRVGQRVAWTHGSIPAAVFSEKAFNPFPLALPPVIPGMHIYMRVKNISCHHSHHFRAALSGAAPAPCY